MNKKELNKNITLFAEIRFLIESSRQKGCCCSQFGNRCLVQRCQWHKRENLVSYFSGKDTSLYRAKLQSAYSEPDYEKAKRS